MLHWIHWTNWPPHFRDIFEYIFLKEKNVFWFICHWSLFLMVQLTICQYVDQQIWRGTTGPQWVKLKCISMCFVLFWLYHQLWVASSYVFTNILLVYFAGTHTGDHKHDLVLQCHGSNSEVCGWYSRFLCCQQCWSHRRKISDFGNDIMCSTHLPLDKMDIILLFPRVQLTITQHWSR